MSIYKLGDSIETHADFNYESNCALCAKPLGKNYLEVLVGDLNVLITSDEYNRRASLNEFVTLLPIGNSCVAKVAKEAVNR